MRQLLNIAPEVADALRDHRPIVALESTVIAHGLPRPQNLQTAQRLQEVVREGGAVPATIAIIGGKLTVGLNDEEIRLLAEKTDIRKISISNTTAQIVQRTTVVGTNASIEVPAGTPTMAPAAIVKTSRRLARRQPLGNMPNDNRPSITSRSGAASCGPMAELASGTKISAPPKPEKPRAQPAIRALTTTNATVVLNHSPANGPSAGCRGN